MTTFKRILKRTLIYTLLVLGLAVLMTFGYVGYQDVTAGKGYLALRYLDRKSTRLNSSHLKLSRMPSSA